MTPRALLAAVLAAVLAASCTPSPSEPPPPAAAAAPASATGASQAPPAPPAPPPPAPVRSALAREPAGATALAATGENVVDPAATFEVELDARLPDARLVLVDAADAHVPAKDVRELGATTRLTLSPEKPLVPASRYVLRVDGAARRELHDADGRAHAPVAFALLVAGDPPPPEPKKPARRRRR